jgi:hypothetical protein
MGQCKQGGSEKAKEAAKVPEAAGLKATFDGARITNFEELRTFMGILNTPERSAAPDLNVFEGF